MLQPNGDREHGADLPSDDQSRHGRQHQHQDHLPCSQQLSPGMVPLDVPKTRAPASLDGRSDGGRDRSRIRFSFDAGVSPVEYDGATRTSLMTEHDHGLGLSGLRRIRQQHHPPRTATLTTSARTPSLGILTRSSSMSTMTLDAPPLSSTSVSYHTGPGSPIFTEDLSRFPSESLHSFSFAHQSEDFIHNRQNILKRSVDFIKDRMGWSVAESAALASAQARLTGDVDTQNMLDLLARAQLVEAGHIPNADNRILGPITGPADMSGENLFEKQFIPRTASPVFLDDSGPPSRALSRAPSRASLADPPDTARRLGASPTPDARPGKLSLRDDVESESSSRTPTNESGTTAATSTSSPPPSRRPTSLRRTYTDTAHASMQQKLIDVMARPFLAQPLPVHDQKLLRSQTSDAVTTTAATTTTTTTTATAVAALNPPAVASSPLHGGHCARWVPAAQAIFTTDARAPWTILAANDLACLVFGVTKAEVRKVGIMEVVQEERRAWLEKKLQKGLAEDSSDPSEAEKAQSATPLVHATSLLGARAGGITAKLLSKPNSRSQVIKTASSRRSATVHNGDLAKSKSGPSHPQKTKSRGVLLCGDVVPIRKRNGATGSASLWVKEKKVGLIWVLEEIHEDVAYVSLDEEGLVTSLTGALGPIWGDEDLAPGMDISRLAPRIPRQGIDPRFGALDYAQIAKAKYFTCRHSNDMFIPATVEQVRGQPQLRISSFPHMAGIVVVDTKSLTIKSSNSVFCGALFGHAKPNGMSLNNLIPSFDKVLHMLMDNEGVALVEGIVVPEHSFRKASALLALKEGRPDAAATFLFPDGLPARHRDGSSLKIDVQMRVVKSEKQPPQVPEGTVVEESSDEEDEEGKKGAPPGTASAAAQSELVFALWITYSRHLHATRASTSFGVGSSPILAGTATPMHQPSPGQTPAHTPQEIQSDSEESKKPDIVTSSLTKHLKDVARTAAAKITGSSKYQSHQQQQQQEISQQHISPEKTAANQDASPGKDTSASQTSPATPRHKKTIDDFVILEDMGQGAYGQVKLARHKTTGTKCVLKYVTKRRILVDTWTRDRRLGTVPLEIHVLDYLRRDGLLLHPNIVEMEDFFEDEVNYYIEMVPHGLPGMDLFDYIELRANMEEREARNMFVQVARAVQHLHNRALVVHRDIKDENVVLDGEGNIKLIDFGSAAYIKSGPFDVFVGTIDYAAPEVLAGKPYGGKEQDVWALGILLYTIIYKENPFYSIDEIMDRDLRVPYTISDHSIDLIRHMLDRDVSERLDIDGVLAHPWCQVEED